MNPHKESWDRWRSAKRYLWREVRAIIVPKIEESIEDMKRAEYIETFYVLMIGFREIRRELD